MIAQCPVPPVKIKVLTILLKSKNLLKSRNQTFPVKGYFTRKLEFFRMIVAFNNNISNSKKKVDIVLDDPLTFEDHLIFYTPQYAKRPQYPKMILNKVNETVELPKYAIKICTAHYLQDVNQTSLQLRWHYVWLILQRILS